LRKISSIIIDAVLHAADSRIAVERSLGFEGGSLIANKEVFPLTGALVLVAAGKASAPMAAAALEAAGGLISRGIIVTPQGYSRSFPPRAFEVISASHPVPDTNAVRAGRHTLELVSSLEERDMCLVLLSGGSSSLLSLPLAPVSLEDLQKTTTLLLNSGADIHKINTVRKHLNGIAGGRLAEAARCRLVTLAISDVVGNALTSIGSGPTVPDPSTFADALNVIEEFELKKKVPSSVMTLLRNGNAGRERETPKSLPERHVTHIIASNESAVEAATREAAACGFTPWILSSALSGEARYAGRNLAFEAIRSRTKGVPIPPPACIIAGGETTVTVRGPGRGGRNQELALSAAIELEGREGILLCSFATDGIDGNTEAAGAYADGRTVKTGRADGLDPERHLSENDSNRFLSVAGDLIVTGPTQTNVNDVSFALVAGEVMITQL
jgi:glycerate 2-kinase